MASTPATPVPKNERHRVATLAKLGVLDYADEERFDRITRVMSALFDVPITMLNMITSDEEVNKSCFGLPAGVHKARSVSFCSYTILSDEPLIIENAVEDDRFSSNPQVTGGINIRAYAGIPLRAIDGTHPGALCLIDTKPHVFTKKEISLLIDLSSWAEIELNSIQLRNALDDIKKAQDEATDRIEIAQEINEQTTPKK
jgi:GAF domain-containing protein